MIGWLLAVALAADPPSCDRVVLPEVRGPVSVAWVAPVGRTVGRKGQLEVVRTAELRGWVARESGGSVGRMLQHLGLQKKARDPKKLWMVAIFDSEPGDLCRPVAGHEEPVAIAGLVSCEARASKPTAGRSGCGYTLDRGTGAMGLEQFRGTWQDLARNGFCVLPAERFIESATGGAGE